MKRIKLMVMDADHYRFGNMICKVDKEGYIIPQSAVLEEYNIQWASEQEMINVWKLDAKKFHKKGKRLIKVYEDGLEVDITPKYQGD